MSSDVLHPGLMSDNHELLEALVRFKLLFGFAFEWSPATEHDKIQGRATKINESLEGRFFYNF